MNFIQTEVNLQYRLSSRWQAYVEYCPTFSLDDIPDNQLLYHRVRAGVRLYTPWAAHFRMYNSWHAEHNFTQRSKFAQRYYYVNDFYYRNASWPWKLRPYLNQRLYWYQNGKELQYYDDFGIRTDRTSPNGLHAYRFQFGMKLYPSANLNLNIFYMKQLEFNTGLFGTLDINSLNPNTGSIRRDFYNFSVIGISATYKI